MKKLFQLGLVACGFFVATLATSTTAKAKEAPAGGGCQGQGDCGTTSQGTVLYGKWVES